ncbi:MFS transporter [Sciscionella marina]|uniref:MFS transporter n=1 Tax=Sciscionella marina TaxID=508770 RepID=UPI00037DC3A9|nr:MFS transporter [Sciscionella marina]
MSHPVAGLAAAAGISGLGTGITAVALPWFVLETTGRGTDLGLVLLAETVGIVFVNAFAGPLIDRLGPRRCAVLFDLLACVVVLAVPVLYRGNLLSLPLLVVLALSLGLSRGPADAARSVLIPDIASRARVRVERVTTSFDAPLQGGRALGAPVAAAIIAAGGAPAALYADAASFVLSSLITLATIAEVRHSRAGEPYLHQLRAGIAFLHRDRLLRSILYAVMVMNALNAGFSSTLLIAYGKQVLRSATAVSVILAVSGAALILGSVLFSAFGLGLRRWPVVAVCYLLWFAPRMVVFLFPVPLWVLVLVVGTAMLLFGPLNPIYDAVKAERVPPELRARVFGAIGAAAMFGVPLGQGVAGVLMDEIGLLPAIAVFTGIGAVMSLSPLVFRAWRDLDRAPLTATVGG